MRKKLPLLKDRELEVMKVLWSSNKPLMISDIIKETASIKWATNSLYPILNRLVDTGYVKIVGKVSTVTTPSKLYAAKITSQQYSRGFLRIVSGETDKDMGIYNILNYFSKGYDNNQDLINEIQAWIDDHTDKED